MTKRNNGSSKSQIYDIFSLWSIQICEKSIKFVRLRLTWISSHVPKRKQFTDSE